MTKEPDQDYARFRHIGYEDFRVMAKDKTLSRHEKVGFPDSYRAGRENLIFDDICKKLPGLNEAGSIVLDIGCGCGDLPRLFMKRANENNQTLLLVDSAEMLDELPADAKVTKIAAQFPDCAKLLADYAGKIDAVLAYSVIQYVFAEGNIFSFLDRTLTLLSPGGRFLIGDIPNISMRKRFFASAAGGACHRAFTGKDEEPVVIFNTLEMDVMDDSVVLALLARARNQGFHAFVMPQAGDLPMANRREDVLIIRP